MSKSHILIEDILNNKKSKAKYKVVSDNEKVVSFLNENAENEFKKQKEKYSAKYEELVNKWWGNPEDIPDSEKSELWKMPDVYVTAQRILTDELIKIGHKDLDFCEEEFIKSNSDMDEMFLFCNK